LLDQAVTTTSAGKSNAFGSRNWPSTRYCRSDSRTPQRIDQRTFRWRRRRNRHCRWITTPDGKARKEIDPPILSPEVAPADGKKPRGATSSVPRYVVATDDIRTAFETAAETEFGRW
jgi:hypothetical protein